MQTGWPPQCSVVTGPHHRLLTQNGTLVRQVFFSKGGQTGKKGLLPNSSIKEPKKTKDGQQQSSLASQGGEKVADRAETVQWDEGELQLRAGVFFPARTNMLFGNVVILQQKLNPSHYAQPTRSSPLAAAETSARSCAPSSLFILRPHSADAWSSPTLNRHRSPITQQKFPSPLFFQRETKPEAKTQVELVMNWLRLSASDSSVSGI